MNLQVKKRKDLINMKLTSKKNGKGYVTFYTISFGCKEAREFKLIDENGNLKKIKYAKAIDDNALMIFLEEI